jgi:glycosyltransferase involved in cell wall biosynthesis
MRDATGITISVVICAFTLDRWEQLRLAVDSVQRQLLAAHELIVVIDHNAELHARAGKLGPGIVVLENSGPRGLSGARNTGVARATGEIVAFLDDDAEAEPDWLKQFAHEYETPEVVAVGGHAEPVWEGQPDWFPSEFLWVVGCSHSGLPTRSAPVRNLIGCNMSFRRSAVVAAGGFATHLGRIGSRPTGCEETELCFRVQQEQPGALLFFLPRGRAGLQVCGVGRSRRYFLRRCYAEGLSKSAVTQSVGSRQALAAERTYTLRTLPKGVLAGISAGLTSPLGPGPQRALTILLGLGVTAAGYLMGRAASIAPRRAAEQSASPTMRPCPPQHTVQWPHVSVIIATRDRSASLERCLDSLRLMTYPHYDVIVVDNAPSCEETRDLVTGRYPADWIRYIREDRPGLAVAHNRGVLHARGEILAFTDDDVEVDPRWLDELVAGFRLAGNVGCVTGAIRPAELATQAQVWLEEFGGFDKGEQARVFDLGEHRPANRLFPYGAGMFGSGANMAFARQALMKIGGFDPTLGAGSKGVGGDDLAAFFDIVTGGFALVYQPAAVVHHWHRRDYEGLRRTVYGYGVGLTAFLTRVVVREPRRLLELLRVLPSGLVHVLASSSAKNMLKGARYPRELTWLERAGMLRGPWAYLQSRREAGS